MTTMNHDQNHDIAGRVLARIDAEHLAPRARWTFVFENYFFWGLGSLAVVLGALAVSAMLFEVTNIDWRLAPATHGTLASLLLGTIPYLWILALALFIGIGYMNVKRTRHGYRYPLWSIALGAVLTSVVLGSGLYLAGLGELVERAPGGHVPFYRPIDVQERGWWLAPEKGLIGGSILSVATDTSSFIVRDFNGMEWHVATYDLRGRDLSTVVEGDTVRIVGLPTSAASSSFFHACFVFPWEMRPGGQPSLPPPAFTASSSERSLTSPRSEECRGIRPYQQLRVVDEEEF